MSQDDLKKLKATGFPPPGVKPDGTPASPPAPPGPPKPDPMLAGVCVMLITVIGNVVTVRAGVDPLTEPERKAVGEAVANVAAQYDLDKLSPQAAAWLGLGVAVAGVAAPRVEQYRRRLAGDPETPQAVPAAAPAPAPDPKPVPAARSRVRSKSRSRKVSKKPAVKKAA